MKIIYMGTPDFAVPALKALANSEHEVCAVFTQPDKPRGRKMIMTPPDVKVCAEKLNIPVYQPETFKDGKPLEIINKYNPDVIVVAAYGKILPKSVLDSAKYGCINLHGSLLPKYRGASPIQQSVLNGDKETGVTAMQMDVGLDTGDILKVVKTEIGVNETSGELFDRLSLMGGELCPIDFTKPAFEVHNKIRGLNPWPIATTEINGKKIKVHSSLLCEKSGKAGTVISTKPLIVACGEKSVELCEIQPEGKKKMTAEAFLAGHRLSVGDVIG